MNLFKKIPSFPLGGWSDGGSAEIDFNRGHRSSRWVKRTSQETSWLAMGRKRYSHETVFGGESFFQLLPSPHKMSNQRRLLLASPPPPPQRPTPPPLPPLPSQPHHRRRNRCPCGECFVRREFNTPGECSFHAKAAVAVGAATTAIAINSGESSTNNSKIGRAHV